MNTTRDFTFVSDTVAGFLKGVQASDVEGGVYNLGTGSDIRIGDLVKRIIKEIGRPVKIVIDQKRLRPEKSEVYKLVSDNSLARKKLSWEPQVDLSTGLRKTIRWIEKNQGIYKSDKYHV